MDIGIKEQEGPTTTVYLVSLLPPLPAVVSRFCSQPELSFLITSCHSPVLIPADSCLIPHKAQGLSMACEALPDPATSNSLTSLTATLPPDAGESGCVSQQDKDILPQGLCRCSLSHCIPVSAPISLSRKAISGHPYKTALPSASLHYLFLFLVHI